ncbi:hypothetical protein ACNQGB_09400 [Flavobacterium sp. XS1P32]|uniref:hypothetical protein n=1 Tax=Flavobacterium sp. XS1P32 TaxID=3401726 RepID=UPI003AADEFE8
MAKLYTTLYSFKYIKFFLQFLLKRINVFFYCGLREGGKRHTLFSFFKKIKIQRTARPKAARRNDKAAAGSRAKEQYHAAPLTHHHSLFCHFPHPFYEISKKSISLAN